MKIIELRFKNLNSLYGEWFIDFSNAEYLSNGIFALTGPTGAGKSSILDAICLALYGQTPRLKKINKSTNEIMSRQTYECYAEVVFESQAGKFLCRWEQRRAHKKVDGKLAEARHEISNAESHELIESKKSLVLGVIEDKIGMDFTRFTKSVLLAQGGFDTFLKANVEEKSVILEQITGTEIYSNISRCVHEQQRSEREKLTLLQAETSGILILEPEEEKIIQENIEKNQKQEPLFEKKILETRQAIDWLISINGLNKDLESLQEESKQLQLVIESFKPQRILFDEACKASGLEGDYATLIAGRKQQMDNQILLKKQEELLPRLNTAVEQKMEALKIAEEQHTKTKNNFEEATPLIKTVRLLDQKLADKKNVIAKSKTEYDDYEKQMKKGIENKSLVQKQCDKINSNLELLQEYFGENAHDELLISELTGIEEQVKNFHIKQQKIEKKKIGIQKITSDLGQISNKLDEHTRQHSIINKAFEQVQGFLTKEKGNLRKLLEDHTLREYRTKKDTLLREMVLLTKISDLEGHRSELEDGKPCPLCGSNKHPFAEGNVSLQVMK